MTRFFCFKISPPEASQHSPRALRRTAKARSFGVQAVYALCTACAWPVLAQAADVPSGQPVTLSEVLTEDIGGQAYVRFRFVTPAIARDGGTVDAEAAEIDGLHLCETLALPYLEEYDLNANQIVVSFSDIPVTFGESSPEATQFFYQFRPENGTCIWELF